MPQGKTRRTTDVHLVSFWLVHCSIMSWINGATCWRWTVRYGQRGLGNVYKQKWPVPFVRANGRHYGTFFTHLPIIWLDAPITFLWKQVPPLTVPYGSPSTSSINISRNVLHTDQHTFVTYRRTLVCWVYLHCLLFCATRLSTKHTAELHSAPTMHQQESQLQNPDLINWLILHHQCCNELNV